MTHRPEPATGVPRRRRALRALLAVPTASAVTAGVLVARSTTLVIRSTTGSARSTTGSAAPTLGAAAVERGRTAWRNSTNTTPTASCVVG